jgi:hypothetical protein
MISCIIGDEVFHPCAIEVLAVGGGAGIFAIIKSRCYKLR